MRDMSDMSDTSNSPFSSRSIATYVLGILQVILIGLCTFILNSSVDHGKSLTAMQSYIENTKERDNVRDREIEQIMRDISEMRARLAVLEHEVMQQRRAEPSAKTKPNP